MGYWLAACMAFSREGAPGVRSCTASLPPTTARAVAPWHLVAGLRLHELLTLPLSQKRFPTTTVVMVLDASTPGKSFGTLIKWIERLRLTESMLMGQLKKSEALMKKLQTKASKRVPPDHEDAGDVEPTVLPLIVVLSKYVHSETQPTVSPRNLPIHG